MARLYILIKYFKNTIKVTDLKKKEISCTTALSFTHRLFQIKFVKHIQW